MSKTEDRPEWLQADKLIWKKEDKAGSPIFSFI